LNLKAIFINSRHSLNLLDHRHLRTGVEQFHEISREHLGAIQSNY
jgi:hypothetical protein